MTRLLRLLVLIWRTQPTLLINFGKALVVVAAAFGFSLSAKQVAAVAGVVIAVGALLNWTQVTPTAKYRALEIRARRSRQPSTRRS